MARPVLRAASAKRTYPARLLRVIPAIIAAGALTVASLPAATANEVERLQRERDQLRERSSRTADRTGSVREDLAEVSRKADDAETRLAAVEERLAAAEERLQRLEMEHAQATSDHRRAVAEVERLDREVATAIRQVERTASHLVEKERVFGSRAAATYKYGGITYAQVLVGAHDFEDFLTSLHFVRSALDQDKRIVDDVVVTLDLLEQQRRTVETLERQALDAEAAAEDALTRVAELTESQRRTTGEVSRDREERRALLAQLEEERSGHQSHLEELEEASQAIEAELATTQAAFEAAKKKAEEEAAARRRAEEERRRQQQAQSGSSNGSSSSSSGGTSGGSGGSSSGSPSASRTGYIWPTTGRVSSGYGYRTHPISGTRRLHTGMDIAAPTGRSIVAAKEGVVVSAGWRGGYGLTVIIDHGGGYASLYAHMSSVAVSPGQWVSRGQHIGAVGSTGASTGPHLHFEIRVNGTPRDPRPYLP